MIKIEHTDVNGFGAAIRGMRNPLNSWDKSDSHWDKAKDMLVIGPNDLALMQKLSKAGTDHGKFLRMIVVSADITAPLYWWKEFDTYKVGTVVNSCSTMHKIHAKGFTLEDFSCEHLTEESSKLLQKIITTLNIHRGNFEVTKDKAYWWQMIQLLPNSYNQKRTVMLNYAVLKAQYHARKNHKLDEWHSYCDWALTLPYFNKICGKGLENEIQNPDK